MTNGEVGGHLIVATISGYMLLLGGWLFPLGLVILVGWVAFTCC